MIQQRRKWSYTRTTRPLYYRRTLKQCKGYWRWILNCNRITRMKSKLERHSRSLDVKLRILSHDRCKVAFTPRLPSSSAKHLANQGLYLRRYEVSDWLNAQR
ncbi:hypothetical protein TNCV_4063391 [Trichonephila clavipes]|nr:hypothetical protein TNCV_4063391 [Trichonephila clavipes]